MLRALAFAWLTVAVSLAGCATGPADPKGPLGDDLAATADAVSGAQGLLWEGKRLEGPASDLQNNPPPFLPSPPRPACGPRNCERFSFDVGDLGGRDLIVAIEWEGQDEDYDTRFFPASYLGAPAVRMDLSVLRDNNRVADGIESFHYAAVAVLKAPPPGNYTAEVVVVTGTGRYIGSAHAAPVGNAPSGGTDLLPDLVMLPPDHPTFRIPLAKEADEGLRRLAPGCGPDETAEDRDLRCLRFAGVLGNQGPGEFVAQLEYDEAARSALSAGNWDQRIQRVDGSHHVVRIGPAEYHAVHGHFHILGFVETTLYRYNESSGERGTAWGPGKKTGFCIIDGGLINPLTAWAPPKYNGDGCCYLAVFCELDLLLHDRFVMGMSPGWYDIYPWWRADQYVEVSGLPDGVYELVSVINPDGFLVESRRDNNEASTVIRVQGESVKVLSQRTQADVGPHPDADWGYRRASTSP